MSLVSWVISLMASGRILAKDYSIESLEADAELKKEVKTNTVQIIDDVLANTEAGPS